MCSMFEEKCTQCGGSGKARGVSYIGEQPDCSFCEGTGCIPKGQKYKF